ncbi:MAG: SPOR domain-containing protein [Candidatus Binatia bacterium]
MAENRREKDRRFYFTRGQMALLGGAFTFTSIIVFVLGMFIGKEIEARKIVRPEEPGIKVPVKPASRGAADADSARVKDDLTFYSTLTKTPAAKPALEPKTEEKAHPIAAKTAVDPKSEPKEARESSGAKTTATTWSVQVNSFPDAKSANELIDRLKNKGYNAFVVEANIKGKLWYRVRVGRFTSREEAEKTEAALKNNENYPKAFATRK